MTVTFDITLDRRYVAAATRAHFGAKYWLMPSLGAFIVVCSGFTTLNTGRVGATSIVLPAMGIVCGLFPVLVTLYTLKQSKRIKAIASPSPRTG